MDILLTSSTGFRQATDCVQKLSLKLFKTEFPNTVSSLTKLICY